jgi:hypothetical protein
MCDVLLVVLAPYPPVYKMILVSSVRPLPEGNGVKSKESAAELFCLF